MLLNVPKDGIAPTLRIDLHHAAVFARRSDERFTLHDVYTNGLFQKHVCARLHGCDGRHGVPVIRRGHDHDIGHVTRQHLVVVRKSRRHVRLPFRDKIQSFTQLFGADITQRGHARPRILDQAVEVHATIPTAADEAECWRLHRRRGT